MDLATPLTPMDCRKYRWKNNSNALLFIFYAFSGQTLDLEHTTPGCRVQMKRLELSSLDTASYVKCKTIPNGHTICRWFC